MKDAYIRVRMSERDKAELERQAAENEMSVSEYIRYMIHKNEKAPE